MQPGSLLECTKKDLWTNKHIGYNSPGPKYMDIVTHDGSDGNEYIFLLEYGLCPCGCKMRLSFNKKFFREVQPPMDIKIEDIISEPEKV